jgi:hypothetical protein
MSSWPFEYRSFPAENAAIALDIRREYTIVSETCRQTRGYAIGAFDIRVTRHGLFTAGQCPYG